MRLTLRSTTASPFGRKVQIAAAVLGLEDAIGFEPAELADQAETLRRQNPLGKVPALVLEDGRALFDSRVIIEYLDILAGGILDAAILILYERRFRPRQPPYEPWLDYQRGKIARAIAALVARPPAIEPVRVGAIGAACALDYLAFRGPYDWRPAAPALIGWLESFAAAVPAFDETRPKD